MPKFVILTRKQIPLRVHLTTVKSRKYFIFKGEGYFSFKSKRDAIDFLNYLTKQRGI